MNDLYPWQERMLKEISELKTKINSLDAWLSDDANEVKNKFSTGSVIVGERNVQAYYISLINQLDAMLKYLGELEYQRSLWENK